MMRYMSLLTRCPACSTLFKVVADQLKVSNGWVRCGQCAHVFDASANLQAMPGMPAPPLPSAFADAQANVGTADVAGVAGSASSLPAPNAVVAPPPELPLPPQTPRAPETIWTPGVALADGAKGLTTSQRPPPAQPDPSDADGPLSEFDPAGWKRDMMAKAGVAAVSDADAETRPGASDADRHVGAAGSEQPAAPGADVDDATDLDDAPAAAQDADLNVSFVNQARRQAFWRKSSVRAALGVAIALLATLLAAQFALHQRDRLAVQQPRLQPALQAMCAALKCALSPLKQIDALLIDSSAFSRVSANAYQLNFVVKNSGALPVAMPFLEVTLTDTQEQPLVRRVVSPEAFGAPGRLLSAGENFAAGIGLQLLPSDAGAEPPRVAGYRVLAFYP